LLRLFFSFAWFAFRYVLLKNRRERQEKNARRSHDAVILVYDDARNVIETHEHQGEFKSGEFA
jgi:hypothetical protein